MEDTWGLDKSLRDDTTGDACQTSYCQFGWDSALCAFTCLPHAVVAGRWPWNSESAIVLGGPHNFHYQLTLLFVRYFLCLLIDHFSLTTPLDVF